MIGYLKGHVLESGEGRVLVGLGAGDAVVGYAVSVPQSAAYGLLVPGSPIELFVYTHVREEALDLYGFVARGEKELFLTLLSVNGIGPKGALSILSGTSPDELVRAITEGDSARLTRIPGIGKKTAERMVVELSDSLRKKMAAGGLRASATAPAGASARDDAKPSGYLDALDALVGLGYRELDASSLLKRLANEGDTPRSAEELIKSALKELR